VQEQRIDGLAVLRRALARTESLCAVMVATAADVDLALAAMREGAQDYQTKPVNLEKLTATLSRGLAQRAQAERLAHLQSRLDERFGFEHFTGHSPAIHRVLEQIRHVAPTLAPVLVTGEPGTGKEWVAHALHQNSSRARERFVRLHFGTLAEEAGESELFGLESSTPLGEVERRAGRLEIADGGTLLLDDIGEAGTVAQTKLARFLDTSEFERAGGSSTVRADVRVVCSTHHSLPERVREGRFRDDLHDRLRAVTIEMPPLRARKEDIPLLVEQFIRSGNRAHGRKVTGINAAAIERLLVYDWPGNVRELANVIEGMVVFAEGKRALVVSDLPVALREFPAERAREMRVAMGQSIEEVERRFIEETLRWVEYDKRRAAETLGIGLRTLYRKLKEYDIV
jgi:DNA-binding NtrC family response regulator